MTDETEALRGSDLPKDTRLIIWVELWSGLPRWMFSYSAFPQTWHCHVLDVWLISFLARRWSRGYRVWCLHQPRLFCRTSSRRGQDLPDSQGLGVGTSCWFGAREWEQYSSPRPTSDQEAQKLAARKGEVGLSMAAWGLCDGLQSRPGEPPASLA